MEKIYMEEYLDNIQRYLTERNETVIVYNNKDCVLQGADSLNDEYCNEHGLVIYKTHGFGGTIVNFKDDICVGNYQPDFNDFGVEFLQGFTEWLKTKGLNAEMCNNDILIDEKYKVASFMSQYTNGCLYTAIHISVGMDIEVIKSICTKPMNKIPKGLNEYGITKEIVDEYILSVIK